jgi:hypothetical protein
MRHAVPGLQGVILKRLASVCSFENTSFIDMFEPHSQICSNLIHRYVRTSFTDMFEPRSQIRSKMQRRKLGRRRQPEAAGSNLRTQSLRTQSFRSRISEKTKAKKCMQTITLRLRYTGQF